MGTQQSISNKTLHYTESSKRTQMVHSNQERTAHTIVYIVSTYMYMCHVFILFSKNRTHREADTQTERQTDVHIHYTLYTSFLPMASCTVLFLCLLCYRFKGHMQTIYSHTGEPGDEARLHTQHEVCQWKERHVTIVVTLVKSFWHL